ncbi:MAG: AI-2E family transporter [Actinomycetota bacterium]|nr:AI-2E family transporter [Actinomycetota bacterium]
MATPLPPRLPATERLRRAGIAAWSLIGILVLLYVIFQLLIRISIIFPPLVLAFLIIYMLNPIVTALEKRGVRRLFGAVGAYVIVLGGITLVIIASIPFISTQVEQLADSWPEYREQLVTFVEDTARSLDDSVGIALPADRIECLLGADQTNVDEAPTLARCDEVTEKLREAVVAQTDRLTQIGSSVLEVLLIFVLAPLLALYLLVDLPYLQRDALNLVPASHQDEFRDLAGKVGRAVGGFFRGQFLVAVTVGLMSALGFALIGLPFWFLIGAIAGFFNLIPLVGPYIGGALGFLVGTVSGGVGLGLRAALVELVVQQIDNHIISPNVMKRTVQIHPATVMLAILAGGAVAGFWGVLLGVPAVAVIKLLLGHVWATRVLGEAVSPVGPRGIALRPDKQDPEAAATPEEKADAAHEEVMTQDPERPT